MYSIRRMTRSLICLIFFAAITAQVTAKNITVRFMSKCEVDSADICDEMTGNCCKIRLQNGNIIADTGKGFVSRGKYFQLFNGKSSGYSITSCGISRKVKGRIIASVLKDEKGIVLTADMDVEDYVPCVLASELDMQIYGAETAKAHAIVIRTFALREKRHTHYDMCDLTHCQVFKGMPEGRIWYDPVIQTKGLVLKGNCARDSVYFSSCCGGMTENAGEFLRGRESSCGISVKDELNGYMLCSQHRYFKWEKHIDQDKFIAPLAAFISGKPEKITDIKVINRTVSGRAKKLSFTYVLAGRQQTVELDANKFMSVFGKISGWALIPSKDFEIYKHDGYFTFIGKGHGHGVGLCLQGAHTLSEMGKTYADILKFYFPDLTIGKY